MQTDTASEYKRTMRHIALQDRKFQELRASFQHVRNEISTLRQRAVNDPQARQRLDELALLYQTELTPHEQTLLGAVRTLETQLETLGADLRLLDPGTTQSPPDRSYSKPKTPRNYC